MVQWRKPPQRSEDMIDLSTKAGAAGRATNRLRNLTAREYAAQEQALRQAELLEEVLLQAMKARAKRRR